MTFDYSTDFANICNTIYYTMAEESLKILEWANNNLKYIKLSKPMDEKPNTNIQQSLMCKSYMYMCSLIINFITSPFSDHFTYYVSV